MSGPYNLPRRLRDIHIGGTDLTPREKEILALYARGYRGTEIADKLSVAYETVKSHNKGILSRLRAKTLHQAVAIAVAMDLI